MLICRPLVSSLSSLQWASHLILKPRQREADAGARLLQLLLRKYVIGLRWPLVLPPFGPTPAATAAADDDSTAVAAQGVFSAEFRVVHMYLQSLLELAEYQLALGGSSDLRRYSSG